MKRKHVNTILVAGIAVVLIVVVALLMTKPSTAATGSPFVGSWSGTDGDGSQLTMVIGGNPRGPFRITITDTYITFCGGEEGIYRGTGSLNPQDPNTLEASINVLCVTTGAILDYSLTLVYNTANDTLLDNFSIIYKRANLQVKECIPPPSGLSNWWPGDGSAYDLISGNFGEFKGDATTDEGMVDRAFKLDGDGDYIEVPDDPALNFGSGDFTVDLWVNFNDLSGEQVLMEKWIQGDPISQGWTLTKLANQALLLAMDDGIGGEWGVSSRVLVLQPNTWYHFAATRQGRSVTLFMNGTTIAGTEIDPLNLDAPTTLKFGRRGGDQGFYLNGLVDEVELFNGTVLTQEQIFGIYLAREYGKCKSEFLPTPMIRAHPEWDNVDGWFWPQDKTITLTVDDPATKKSPDIKMALPGTLGPTGSLWFELGDYDLKAGDLVTMTDGVITKSMVVSNLTIDTTSQVSSIVAGSADPGDTIRLPIPGEVFATADEYGQWIADFTSVGLFIQPESPMIAEESDADGDMTSFDIWISSAAIVASEAGDWFWFGGFNPGVVYLSISESADAGAAVLWSGQVETDPSGITVVGKDLHGLDLVPGNYVVVSDGQRTKGIALQPISVTVFDTDNEIMAGYAPPGSLVWAAAGPAEWQQRIMVHADHVSGAWMADFTTIGFDITEEMRGWSFAHIYDKDADANEGSTPPPPPNPHFTIFPEWEWFDGWEWPDEGTITITVDGKTACTQTASSGGFFNGGFPEGCDVQIGDIVRMTDGTTTKVHTVQNLAITVVDGAEDTVAGNAGNEAEIHVWPHATGQEIITNAGYDGSWQVDFTGIFDLVPNECGRAQIYDEEGNGTAIDWCVPATSINVFPEGDYVEIHRWRLGVTATATIIGKNGCTGSTVPIYPDWEPRYRNPMQIYFPAGCDIVAGDTVAVDNGITHLEHIAQNLSITAVDGYEDTVSGTADPGANVLVWPHGFSLPPLNPVVGMDGNWSADFTEFIDLVVGMCGRSAIFDAAGNSTSVDWCVP